MKINTLGWILFTLFFSCGQKNDQPKLPNTPESVVRQWQAYIDKNQFDAALQLSTGQAVRYIQDDLSGFTEDDTMDIEQNLLLDLKCTVMGDSAICTYSFEDEIGEKIPGKLALRKFKGQWLVSRTDFESDLPDPYENGQKELGFPGDTTDVELE